MNYTIAKLTAAAGHTSRVALVIAGWTLVGVMLATQAWLATPLRAEPVAWTRTLGIWLAWGYLWALLTPLALGLAARFPFVPTRRVRAALVHGVAGPALAALNLALFALIAPGVDAVSVEPSWAATFSRLLATAFLMNVPVYWLIVGIAQVLRLGREARERERRALQLEAQLAEARLLMLRAQLEPHFLFNTLNTIAVLMRDNVDAADRVLILLSGLLRRALDTSGLAEVRLREEVAFLEAYLALEKIRFDAGLSYQFDIEPQLLEARVPSLILQPLVENAIRHGLHERAQGRIRIAATRNGEQLQLTVSDNGAGLGVDAPAGVGLSNTRSRLQLLYGCRHSFELRAAPDGGTVARLVIPVMLEAQ